MVLGCGDQVLAVFHTTTRSRTTFIPPSPLSAYILHPLSLHVRLKERQQWKFLCICLLDLEEFRKVLQAVALLGTLCPLREMLGISCNLDADLERFTDVLGRPTYCHEFTFGGKLTAVRERRALNVDSSHDRLSHRNIILLLGFGGPLLRWQSGCKQAELASMINPCKETQN